MNKRSAVLVAAGLVVALIAGGLALGYGIVGPEPSAAVTSAGSQQREPKIRTITKTVKIHKKANGSVATPAPGPSGSSWQGDDDERFENGGEIDHESSDDGEGSTKWHEDD